VRTSRCRVGRRGRHSEHFVGYSASRSGRNLAPVSIGARELADVFLPPFEMALRSGARSVMNSYTDLDGVR